AAGDALGLEKIDAAGRDFRFEAAAENRQREGSLHLLAGADAARADYALCRVKNEIGIGGVDWRAEMIGAVVPVSCVGDAQCLRMGPQFGVADSAGGEAVERVVGNIELH